VTLGLRKNMMVKFQQRKLKF